MNAKMNSGMLTLVRGCDVGGKMMGGRRVSRAEGEAVAKMAFEELSLLLERFEVCGSIRREKEEAGDVDVVVLPRPGKEKELEERLREVFGSQKNGKPKHSGLIDDVQVDVNVAGPENWGAMWMHATGSKEWNVLQRARAKKMGLMLNEKGLFERTMDDKGKPVAGRRVAGATEMEVYKALGMEFRTPRDREASFGRKKAK